MIYHYGVWLQDRITGTSAYTLIQVYPGQTEDQALATVQNRYKVLRINYIRTVPLSYLKST